MEPLNKQFEYMFKYLTAYSKTNISNVLDANELYDVLYIQVGAYLYAAVKCS